MSILLAACGGGSGDTPPFISGDNNSPSDPYSGIERSIELSKVDDIDQLAKGLLAHLTSNNYLGLFNQNSELWGEVIDAIPDSSSGNGFTTVSKTESPCAAGGSIIRREARSFTELEYRDCNP